MHEVCANTTSRECDYNFPHSGLSAIFTGTIVADSILTDLDAALSLYHAGADFGLQAPPGPGGGTYTGALKGRC